MTRFNSIAVAASAALALASTAHAQHFDREWTPMTTSQGCVFYEQKYLAEMAAAEQWTYTWMGSCTPGQPISGVGVLSGVQPMGDRNDISGRFVRGYKDGVIRFTRRHADTIQPAPPPTPDVVVRYNMGCGLFDRNDQCRPARR